MTDTIPIKDAIEVAFDQEGSRYDMCCKRCHNIVVEYPETLCEECKTK